jgi:hypothetical protein
VKSLPAHAIRSLITARKKLVGQRVNLENHASEITLPQRSAKSQRR